MISSSDPRSSRQVETFDGFATTDLDRWSVLEIPVGDGRVHRHADANATVTVSEGVVEIEIPQFSLSYDGSYMLDGPKQMYVSRETFAIVSDGVTRFGVEMRAENHAGNPDDPRDAIATFNIVDFECGLVFDVAMSSAHIWAVRERLPVPGVSADETFSYLVESPFVEIDRSAEQMHACVIEFHPRQRAVSWIVDGVRIYDAGGLEPFPSRVSVGFAVITLHSQPDGVSTSIRGQGMRGRWRRFSHEVDPG